MITLSVLLAFAFIVFCTWTVWLTYIGKDRGLSGTYYLIDQATAIYWAGIGLLLVVIMSFSPKGGVLDWLLFVIGSVGFLLLFTGLFGLFIPFSFLRAKWWKELRPVRKAWDKLPPDYQTVLAQSPITLQTPAGEITGWEVTYPAPGYTSEDFARMILPVHRFVSLRLPGTITGSFTLSQNTTETSTNTTSSSRAVELLADNHHVLFVQRPSTDFTHNNAWFLSIANITTDNLTIAEDGKTGSSSTLTIGTLVFTPDQRKPVPRKLRPTRLRRALNKQHWFYRLEPIPPNQPPLDSDPAFHKPLARPPGRRRKTTTK